MQATGAPAPPRPAKSRSWLAWPRITVVVTAALVVVALIFGVAISADQQNARQLEDAQAELGTARTAIAAHAQVMRTQGEALVAAAQSSTSPYRDDVIADAQSMIADAARLDGTVSLLANQARLLGQHPGQSVRSNLTYIHQTGDALVAEGDQLVAYAATIREHAAAMDALAGSGAADIVSRTAALLRDGAGRLIDAGQRTRSIGVTLGQAGDRFMRSLGR